VSYLHRALALGAAILVPTAALEIGACSSTSGTSSPPADAATELKVVTFDGPTPFEAAPSEAGSDDAPGEASDADEGDANEAGNLGDTGAASDANDGGEAGD
jgi:hypothetical protein